MPVRATLEAVVTQEQGTLGPATGCEVSGQTTGHEMIFAPIPRRRGASGKSEREVVAPRQTPSNSVGLGSNSEAIGSDVLRR